jgi:hypothetical protein
VTSVGATGSTETLSSTSAATADEATSTTAAQLPPTSIINAQSNPAARRGA